MRNITLQEMVHRSSSILLVRKVKAPKAEEAGHFEILSVLKSEDGLTPHKPLQVLPAWWDAVKAEEKRQAEGKGHKILLQPSYKAEGKDLDSASEVLIFVHRNGESGRYLFTAEGAVESKTELERVRGIIGAGPLAPPEPGTSPIPPIRAP